MILTGLILLMAYPQNAAASSPWSFRSGQEAFEIDDKITMVYYQYKKFELLKNNVWVSESNDEYDDYTVIWKSSNTDAVWINKHTGQARANKFHKLKDDYGTTKISAIITNVKTGEKTTYSFTVEVDNRAYTKPQEEILPVAEATPTPEVTSTPITAISNKNDDPASSIPTKNGIKKLTLGSTWKTDVAVLLDTFDFFYEDNVIPADGILGIGTVDCVEVGTPVSKVYIRTLPLKVRVKTLNPNWEDPNQYITQEVIINHTFDIVY